MSSHDLYSVLGVSEDAEPQDIKRAYYALVRLHPPEKDPEGFRRIKEAYDTLSSADARADYDATRHYGDEIEALMDEGRELMESEDWTEAARCFKKVVALMPTSDSAWNQLGLCYAYDSEWDKAEKTYKSLIGRKPEVSLYWANLGHCYLQKAESDGTPEAIADARQTFLKAFDLEKINANHALNVAKTYRMESAYDEAISWCEKAIGADGKADFQDFDALFEIAILHSLKGDISGIQRTGERIKSLSDLDVDRREYIAARFVQMASTLFDLHHYDVAESFAKTARQFDPTRRVISDLETLSRQHHLAIDEFKTLENDAAILHPIKAIAYVKVASIMGEEDPDDHGQIVRGALQNLITYPKEQGRDSLNRLKIVYPNLYAIGQEGFDHVMSVLGGKVAGSAGSSAAKSGCGCLLWLLCGSIGSAIGQGPGLLVGLLIGYGIFSAIKE